MVFTLVALFASVSINVLFATASTAVNRTIDDQHGDSVTGALPSYSPSDGWAIGNTCNGCRINRTNTDVSKAFDGTWSDTTYHPGQPDRFISMSFVGTDIYVFNIIANQVIWTTTLTNLTLSVDGTHVDSYLHSPDLTSNMEYQVMVLKHNNMPNVAHNIEIRATGSEASLVLFDYVIYTFQEGSPPPSSITTGTASTPAQPSVPSTSPTSVPGVPDPNNPPSQSSPSSSSTLFSVGLGGVTVTPSSGPPDTATPVGVIAGGALGGVTLTALVAIVFCLLRKRRRIRNAHHSAAPTLNRRPSLVSHNPPTTSPTISSFFPSRLPSTRRLTRSATASEGTTALMRNRIQELEAQLQAEEYGTETSEKPPFSPGDDGMPRWRRPNSFSTTHSGDALLQSLRWDGRGSMVSGSGAGMSESEWTGTERGTADDMHALREEIEMLRAVLAGARLRNEPLPAYSQ